MPSDMLAAEQASDKSSRHEQLEISPESAAKHTICLSQVVYSRDQFGDLDHEARSLYASVPRGTSVSALVCLS